MFRHIAAGHIAETLIWNPLQNPHISRKIVNAGKSNINFDEDIMSPSLA